MSNLLAIIYIAFISLGLPDAILGSAWPVMQHQFHVPVSYAGIVTVFIAGGTVISSLNSDRLTKRFGTGMVTAVSVGMTALALGGFSIAPSFLVLCIFAIPYGLGAGAVDAALNNYVALHYEARHMSWLHCFWGIGATMGPYIIGAFLTGGYPWTAGYRGIGLLQVVLTAVLFSSLPLWQNGRGETAKVDKAQRSIGFGELIRKPGALPGLLAFFCYCALEHSTGLWASSYMVDYRGIDPQTAAKWASLFYLGITLGRFIGGFVTFKLDGKGMIRLGTGIILSGIVLMVLPLSTFWLCAGLVLVGFGCAPIYPSLLHDTPRNFGSDDSQAVMGIQMASAYVGIIVMPAFFGLLIPYISIKSYPLFLLVIALLMTFGVEKLNRLPKHAITTEE